MPLFPFPRSFRNSKSRRVLLGAGVPNDSIEVLRWPPRGPKAGLIYNINIGQTLTVTTYKGAMLVRIVEGILTDLGDLKSILKSDIKKVEKLAESECV